MAKICGTFEGYEGELGHKWGLFTSPEQSKETKLFFQKRCKTNEKQKMEKILEELKFLNQLNHRNIQKIIDVFADGEDSANSDKNKCFSNFYVYSLLAEFGSVERIIATTFENGLPEEIISYIFVQIVQAVEYLNERRIIHRAINASHILISSNGIARLGGFSHAICIDQCNRWIGVNDCVHDFDESLSDIVIWLAPEILKQDLIGYGTKSDVYSLGITVCEIGNGFAPFCEMEPLQVFYEKIRGSTPFLLDSLNSTAINNAALLEDAKTMAQSSTKSATNDLQYEQHSKKLFTPEIHDFVTKCLVYNSEERLTSTQLLAHEFLKRVKEQNVELLLSEFLSNNAVPLILL